MLRRASPSGCSIPTIRAGSADCASRGTPGTAEFRQTKAAVIARVDVTHKQSGAVDKQTRFIGGVSYQLSPNWRLLGDWDYANYQTPALNATNYATRSQALFQTQFTF